MSGPAAWLARAMFSALQKHGGTGCPPPRNELGFIGPHWQFGIPSWVARHDTTSSSQFDALGNRFQVECKRADPSVVFWSFIQWAERDGFAIVDRNRFDLG